MTTPSNLLSVAVPVPLTDALEYRWAGPGAPPRPGCRVRVPLGRGERIGVVVGHPSKTSLPSAKIKNVIEVMDEKPVLAEELLRTLQWCADYYHHPIGEVMNQALPVLLRQGRSPVRAPAGPWELTAEGRAQDAATVRRRARRQGDALDILRRAGSDGDGELRAQGVAGDVLRRMKAKGWIRRQPQRRTGASLEPSRDTPPTLTSEQQHCVDTICASPPGYRTYLLQGVTGSGKTEVYLRLIARELEAGRQSLLLVPEIGLTPQLIGRLRKRFAQQLAVMHSGLAPGRRLDAWQDARTGAARLIVGTRSAVFAPFANPGLIIVDEEHDPSFKQQEGFRYSARDLAVLRAQRLNIPILLGSATPSLESVHNAERGQYLPLSISRRIGTAGHPDMRVIDMNRHADRQGLSTPLVTSIRRHLDADCQVLLFLNRRGFAPVLLCPTCGTAEDCDRCDARMTIHAASGRLRCHHCGRTHGLSWVCAACGSERIAVGAGTQRVTGELAALFPMPVSRGSTGTLPRARAASGPYLQGWSAAIPRSWWVRKCSPRDTTSPGHPGGGAQRRPGAVRHRLSQHRAIRADSATGCRQGRAPGPRRRSADTEPLSAAPAAPQAGPSGLLRLRPDGACGTQGLRVAAVFPPHTVARRSHPPGAGSCLSGTGGRCGKRTRFPGRCTGAGSSIHGAARRPVPRTAAPSEPPAIDAAPLDGGTCAPGTHLARGAARAMERRRRSHRSLMPANRIGTRFR